jgi:hypothetical protein
VWPHNGHEIGAGFQCREQIRFLSKLLDNAEPDA